MFHFVTRDLTNLIGTYGYLAVFLFVGIESIGIPFPGETMLVTASIYAGTTHRLSIVFVIAAAAAGRSSATTSGTRSGGRAAIGCYDDTANTSASRNPS